jgi:hypothetical protein
MNLSLQGFRVKGRVQAQLLGEPGELVGKRRRFFGTDPVHEVIVTRVKIGIFVGQLGLAHAAHSAQRLHRHR